MGVYNTYGKASGQLKVGVCRCTHFNVGDVVDIPDGVYLTYSNVIVVIEGKFAAEFEILRDKWGSSMYPNELIGPRNPMNAVIKDVTNEFT